LGVTAAITEMLMQSQDKFIRLLPALPDAWANGSFKGVCARGAFELNYSWQNKKINSLSITSNAGKVCRIEYKPDIKIISGGISVAIRNLPGGIIEFNTVKGRTYTIE
jgi:alpha-L-fucosidase 2